MSTWEASAPFRMFGRISNADYQLGSATLEVLFSIALLVNLNEVEFRLLLCKICAYDVSWTEHLRDCDTLFTSLCFGTRDI